ncbi:tRNA(Arg) A34 adenosine deaminase TadA [Halapricum desulfuricans]|uniref:tRNA(Arg) A34 adenosine deaminase TadA n=1 Tax=Halapricum desulfuricans TaxID=2841257 RepID=A0A897NHK9_9EURY|nr:tRNA(Arg) A34 adenosine deaminase TadA [Halapricum desulfuricans]
MSQQVCFPAFLPRVVPQRSEEVIERKGGATDVDGPILESAGLDVHESVRW